MQPVELIQRIKTVFANASGYAGDQVDALFQARSVETQASQQIEQNAADMQTAGWMFGLKKANDIVQVVLRGQPAEFHLDKSAVGAQLSKSLGLDSADGENFTEGYVAAMRETKAKLEAPSGP